MISVVNPWQAQNEVRQHVNQLINEAKNELLIAGIPGNKPGVHSLQEMAKRILAFIITL